ncbi:MAG TPA: hypothetical protein VK927_09530, partial [Adhaeribacter sp.]|nr:hypothetical protein [Adhaeribacter sp.]
MKKIYLFLAMLMGGVTTQAQTCNTTISTFPHIQDFESSTAGAPGTLPTGWTTSPTSGYRWEIQDGPVTSLNTGPATDHTTGAAGGKYPYTESSSGSTGADAMLISPCFNITSLTTPGFDFWYHMYGATMGSMEIQISSDTGATWTTVFTLTGEQQTASSDPWIKKTISLAGYTGTVQVRFRGIRGTSFTSDMAIDDFKIYNIPPNDAGVVAINTPTSPVNPGVSVPVSVTLKNFGGSNLTSATVGYSVDGTVVLNNHSFTGNLTGNQTSSPITLGNTTFTAGTHTLKAWTSSPNGATDGDMSNDTTTVHIIACSSLSGTYTIDKNSAASATNFQSVALAAQALTSCGISGPVTFNVVANSGPYNDQVVLTSIPGTSATNTVTFNGNGNSIVNAPSGNYLGIISLDDADYVKFDNFILTLDAAASAGLGVQLMNQADHNTISNTTINLPLTVTSSAVSGIIAGANVSTAGNNTNNSKFENNTINGGYYAIRLNGPTGSTGAIGNQILNNTIQDNYIYNIYLSNQENALVEGNDISRPTRSSVSSFYGVYMTGTSKNNVINANRFHNSHGGASSVTGAAYVIYLSSTDAPSGSENIISNNLIYDIGTNGTIYALYNIGSNGAHYFHNTIDLSNPNSTGTVRGLYQTTSASNVKFQNNIVTITAASSGVKTGLYFNTAASAITSNNNVLYVPVGNVGYKSGAQTTLADWQSAASSDANSVSVDPMYLDVAAGNLKPTNSTVNNIGALVGVTTDITGATRSTTAPDPGAYEFTPPANDAGITAIITPTSPVSPGVSQPVEVTIKNFGLSNLTSATINWSIDGTAQTP